MEVFLALGIMISVLVWLLRWTIVSWLLVHYVLVNPQYQKYGIGKKLMQMMLEHYKDYHKVCLIGVNTAVGFYEHLGFEVNEKAKPMFYLNKNY